MPEKNPYRPFPVRVAKITPESGSEFTFTVEASADMTPGQFFEVSLPKIGEAPISISGFGPGWIQFTIRAVGRLTNALQCLREGERIFIRGPYGVGFPLDVLRDSNLVIVAGGSGLAPVRPLIHRIMDGGLPVRSAKVIAGFKSRDGILFAREAEAWRKSCDVLVTVDKPQEGWNGPTGLVTEHVRALRIEDPLDVQFVVVGPPVMMKFTTAEVRLLGVPADRIWVSFERLMSCGLGKCGHCKIDSAYVCLDGPVFSFSRAAGLID
mgnify:CR=1 FL=1